MVITGIVEFPLIGLEFSIFDRFEGFFFISIALATPFTFYQLLDFFYAEAFRIFVHIVYCAVELLSVRNFSRFSSIFFWFDFLSFLHLNIKAFREMLPAPAGELRLKILWIVHMGP